MRIHCLENVDKALQFLREQRVHLENMGSHDIVDGNPRLSLGMEIVFLGYFSKYLSLEIRSLYLFILYISIEPNMY